jgi:hypothetical protein
MPTTQLYGNERTRVQIKPFDKDIFIDIENQESEALTVIFHRMHFFQIRKRPYGTKVFVFDSEERMKEFDFKDYTEAEIIYTNIP